MASPASAHGGGGTFNGGTITEPLVISLPALSEDHPLTIQHADYPDARILLNLIGSAGPNEGSAVIVLTAGGTGYSEVMVQDQGTGVGFLDSRFGPSGYPDVAAPGSRQCLAAGNSNGDDTFEVRADGSVHIKTGTTVIADL